MTDPVAPVPEEPTVIPPPRPRVPWFALLLATALTLAGASFAVGAYQADGLPETVVRAYFAALRDGDAAAALGYGDVPAGPHDLLTPTVLAAQNAMGPIENVAVRQVRTLGDSAVVDVTYTVDLPTGPDPERDTVELVRHGHGWRMTRSAVAVKLAPNGGSALASFAGANVPTGDFLMFPGAVPVRYDTPNLELDPSAAVVRFVDGGALDVQADVSAAGQRAIVPRLRTALAACLAGTSTAEPLCPVPDTAQDVPGSLRGTVTEVSPTKLDLTVDSPDGKIDIDGTVSVHGTYQQLDQNNIASARTTEATNISAYCYATAPHLIGWSAS